MNAIDQHRAGNVRSRMFALCSLFALALIVSSRLVWASRDQGQVKAVGKVDYNRDVRPILARNCFACHGQDESKRAKGLRLDRRDAAVKPLKNGDEAIVPGDPESSELIVRVTEEDDMMRMPPRKAGNRLIAEEVDILRGGSSREPNTLLTGHLSIHKQDRFPGSRPGHGRGMASTHGFLIACERRD